ncbi:NAD(P)-dependent alcohol dehydrogenase [Flavobacteriaceae bacterium]|nr:NAD(P)-dependent alcohol dehydrogenase [Flavobacteriaceae bacterium]
MKAFIHNRYGAPKEVLQLTEIDTPIPLEDEVLVQIKATTINDYDWSLITGKPYLYRLLFGLFKPKNNIAGMELAGIITQVGKNVTKWKIGDEVFGDISDTTTGSFAEYIAVKQEHLLAKPKELSFTTAASIPHAGALAYQALHDIGNIKENQTILINGAGGGVGTLALQIAKQYNCIVTGVDSIDKFDMLRSLGFDSLIDYKQTNFTKENTQYDLVLDCKTNKAPLNYLKALKPNGKYVSIGGTVGKLLSLFFWSKVTSLFSQKSLAILALKTNTNLDKLLEGFNNNTYKGQINGPYPFEQLPEQVAHFGAAKHKGKIVITFENL